MALSAVLAIGFPLQSLFDRLLGRPVGVDNVELVVSCCTPGIVLFALVRSRVQRLRTLGRP